MINTSEIIETYIVQRIFSHFRFASKDNFIGRQAKYLSKHRIHIEIVLIEQLKLLNSSNKYEAFPFILFI